MEYKYLRPNNYITICGDDILSRGLKGNELIVFGIINGFSQDGESEFYGSLTYLQEFTSLSRQGVINILEKLISEGHIAKIQSVRNGITYNSYKTLQVVKKVDYPLVKKVDTDIEIYISNNKDIKEIKKEKLETPLDTPYTSPMFMEWWEKVRSLKKWKPKTASQLQFSLDKLAKVSEEDAIECLKATFENGWQGVFVEKCPSYGLKGGRRTTTPQSVDNGLKTAKKARKTRWEELGMTEEQYKKMMNNER